MVKNTMYLSQYHLLDCENSQLAMTSIANYYRERAIDIASAIDSGLKGESSLISIPVSYSKYIDGNNASASVILSRVDLSCLQDIDFDDPNAMVEAVAGNGADIEIPAQDFFRTIAEAIDQSTGISAIMAAAAEKGLDSVVSISDVQSRISAMGLKASSYISDLVTSCPSSATYMSILSPVVQTFSKATINKSSAQITIPNFDDYTSGAMPVVGAFSSTIDDLVSWISSGVDAALKATTLFGKLFSGLGTLLLKAVGLSVEELNNDFILGKGMNGLDIPYITVHFNRSELNAFLNLVNPYMQTLGYKRKCSIFWLLGVDNDTVQDSFGWIYLTNQGMRKYCYDVLDYVETHGNVTIPLGNTSMVVTCPSQDNYYVHLYMMGAFNPQLGALAEIDPATLDWTLIDDPANVNQYQYVADVPSGASNGEVFNWMKKYLDLSDSGVTNRHLLFCGEESYAERLYVRYETPSNEARMDSYNGFGTVFDNPSDYDIKSDQLVEGYWHRFELGDIIIDRDNFDYQNDRFYGKILTVLLCFRQLALGGILVPFDGATTTATNCIGFNWYGVAHGSNAAYDYNITLDRIAYYPYSSSYMETFCMHPQTYSEKANEYRKIINAGLVAVGVAVATVLAIKVRGKLKQSLFNLSAQASQAFYGLNENSTPADYKKAFKLDKKYKFFSKILEGAAGNTITNEIMSFNDAGSQSTVSALNPQLQRILSSITPNL